MGSKSLFLLAGLVVAAGCNGPPVTYLETVPMHYFVKGGGAAKLGTYELSWFFNRTEQVQMRYADQDRNLESPAVLMLHGPETSDQFQLKFDRTTVDGSTGNETYSVNEMQIRLNEPATANGLLLARKVPDEPATVKVKGTLIQSRRVWDTMHVTDAGYQEDPGEHPNIASGRGTSKWNFQKSTFKSDQGWPAKLRSHIGPFDSDQIEVDLVPLKEKLGGKSFLAMITEATTGPDMAGGGGTSGASFNAAKWQIFLAPRTPFFSESKHFEKMWIRYYVDVVVAEYPFEMDVMVSTKAP